MRRTVPQYNKIQYVASSGAIQYRIYRTDRARMRVRPTVRAPLTAVGLWSDPLVQPLGWGKIRAVLPSTNSLTRDDDRFTSNRAWTPPSAVPQTPAVVNDDRSPSPSRLSLSTRKKATYHMLDSYRVRFSRPRDAEPLSYHASFPNYRV